MDDMGRIVKIEGNTFTTSTGLTFEFPFPVPSVTVDELNELWKGWVAQVNREMENGQADTSE